MSFIAYFLYSQFAALPYPTTRCDGKTICVTGSNVGLGKEAARHFVRLGAEKVIMAVRSTEKGEEAKTDIEGTEKRSGVVEVWPLDLSSYESVKQFAARLNGLKRLDALLENAGIATKNFQLAEENERSITVNVINTFLLALLALPVLKRTAQEFNITPNLTITSSEVHALAKFPERKSSDILKALSDKNTTNMGERYYVSKLLEVFFIREFCKLHPEPYPVTVNFLNPGLCHSELTRESDGWAVYLMKLVLARTTEVGSRTLVQAGLAGPETHGQYLSNCQVASCSALVTGPEGPEVQKKVFDEIRQTLEAVQPGIMANA